MAVQNEWKWILSGKSKYKIMIRMILCIFAAKVEKKTSGERKTALQNNDGTIIEKKTRSLIHVRHEWCQTVNSSQWMKFQCGKKKIIWFEWVYRIAPIIGSHILNNSTRYLDGAREKKTSCDLVCYFAFKSNKSRKKKHKMYVRKTVERKVTWRKRKHEHSSANC